METVLFAVALIVVWLWGAVFGWQARERHAERKLNELLQHVEGSTETQENHIHIVIEKHNDVFYVYGKDDNQFMAQASTVKELEEALQKRYPGKKFACPEKNMIEVGLIS